MTKCKFILPLLAGMAMAGCMTTEKMPDGTTKIRFSDEAVSSLSSMMPSGVVNGLAGGGGDLDLIPTLNPTGSSEFLYLGGKFDYECTAALMYSAYSGKPLAGKTSDNCRQSYLIRQQQLKLAGKPYDRAAPAFDAYNPNQAYWASMTAKVISQLKEKQQFTTRFTSVPRYEKSGKLFIAVGFLGRSKGQDYALAATPARTQVMFSDPRLEAQMRSKANNLNTAVGDATLCDVVLAPKGAVDKGPKPASVYGSDYARYEVRFAVTSLSCKSGLYEFKNVAK